MPTIKELLASEQFKDRLCIQLYSEDIFFKAYEHSAWLVYHILNRFIQTMPAVSEAYPYASAEQATAGVVICIMDQANGVSQIREFL